jgi:hypothetical protein
LAFHIMEYPYYYCWGIVVGIQRIITVFDVLNWEELKRRKSASRTRSLFFFHISNLCNWFHSIMIWSVNCLMASLECHGFYCFHVLRFYCECNIIFYSIGLMIHGHNSSKILIDITLTAKCQIVAEFSWTFFLV